MTENTWTRWPSREALGRAGISRSRRMLARAVRLLVLAVFLWWAFSTRHVHAWSTVAAVAGVIVVAVVSWAFFRTTYAHRLLPDLRRFAHPGRGSHSRPA